MLAYIVDERIGLSNYLPVELIQRKPKYSTFRLIDWPYGNWEVANCFVFKDQDHLLTCKNSRELKCIRHKGFKSRRVEIKQKAKETLFDDLEE